MTCESGVMLAARKSAAAKPDGCFPLSLGAEGSCTIGGNLSTNAGGTGGLVYGRRATSCSGSKSCWPTAA
jgi:D-lactate dehydrogenase (cytochrome)